MYFLLYSITRTLDKIIVEKFIFCNIIPIIPTIDKQTYYYLYYPNCTPSLIITITVKIKFNLKPT